MTDFFLRAKHWHVFLVVMGMPLVVLWYFFYTLVQSYADDTLQEVAIVDRYLDLFPIICLVSIVPALAWLWSLGTGLQQKIPPALRLKTKLFTATTVFILAFYGFFFTVFMPDLFVKPEHQILLGNGNWLLYLSPVYVLIGLGTIYQYFFIAKSIQLAEQQQPVTTKSWLGSFFLLWVFPIGVWWVQPRVRQLFEETSLENEVGLLA